jgi:hypothetical protein
MKQQKLKLREQEKLEELKILDYIKKKQVYHTDRERGRGRREIIWYTIIGQRRRITERIRTAKSRERNGSSKIESTTRKG